MKFAVIGTWGHYGEVLRELEDMEDAQCVGWSKGMPEDNIEDVKRRFEKTAECQVFESHCTLLEHQSPELVIISTRLDRISALTVDAVKAGCHVICEKPLAITEDELYQLWDTVKANGVQCLAMLNNRCHPLLAATRATIKDGEIGEVKLINARKSYRFGDRPDWFGQRSIYGGTIPWVGIHAFDFIEAITSTSFSAVSAFHRNAAHPAWPDCEDIAGILVSLQNGGLATVSIDYLRPAKAPTHGDDWLRVVGTEGIVEAAISRDYGTVQSNQSGSYYLPTGSRTKYYSPRIRAFTTANTTFPNADTRRGFMLTQAALCARKGADNGIVKRIPIAPWSQATM
ncbi:MAG: Gfo/Idh/MocA family protein [Verrucomicrobiota bacterium]